MYGNDKVMMRYTCLLVLVIGFGSSLAPEAHAALDATRWQPTQADTPVWWDNIKDAPFWVRGPKPQFHQAWKMHTVALQPGQTITLHVPQGRALRVYHPTWRLTHHDLNFSLSNGSGLHVSHAPQANDDPHSLIFTPANPEPLVELYISRPPQHQGMLRVALFLSRYDPLPAVPYRDFIAFDLPMVPLQTKMYGPAQRFWSLKPHTAVAVNIQGPVRLAVENRFVYDPTVHHAKQTYRIHTHMDRTPLRVLDFDTDVQISRPVFIDDKPQPVGRLEVDYVNIPPGPHTLELQSTAPIYLRLLRQARADYLFPAINWPSVPSPVDEVASSLLQTPIWQMEPHQLRRIITLPARSVVELDYLAKRLWRDNRHQDGGLQAAMLLQGAAAARPYDAPLRQVAARQLSASTRYQTLLPEHKTALQPPYFGWFVTPHLAPLDHDQARYAAAKQHQEDLTSQLTSGQFVPLSAHPQVDHYVLPPRSAPSELRVVADTTDLSQPQELWLQFDQQPPIRMHLIPQTVVSTPNLLPTPGDIGLTLLRLQNPAFDNGTLGGPFSSRHTPAPRLRTAYATLPLPIHIQSVTVWQAHNRSEVVSIALQYRVSKPFRLAERDYLDALQRLGSPAARYALLLDHIAALQHGPATFDTRIYPQRAAIEVLNQWLPLMRLLRARYKRFVSALTPLTPLFAEQSRVAAEQLRTQAKRAETSGDWLAALQAWTSIANASQGVYRQEAHMGQVSALAHLGRHPLADQLLRGMMLFDADAHLRLQAFNRLLATYRQAENATALGALLAVAAVRQHHPDALRMLITQLAADGQDQSALQVGLALPASQRPLTALLQSAWRLGWWQVFDDLLQQLDTAEERHYWRGYRAVHQADYDAAQHHFLQGGSQGQALAAAIAQAQIIHADLRSQEAVKQEAAVLSWETWQARHPGPHIWQREPQLTVDYAGSMRLYQASLDLHSQWYRSEADRPVQLRFLGPLRLRLTVRPLHPKSLSDALASPLDGWIKMDHDAQHHWIPIMNNHPTSDLTGPDHSPWQPGQLITEALDFGPGLHTVTITGQTIPLLIQTDVQRPAQPLGILPPLTPATLHAMLHPQSDNSPHTYHGRSCTTCLYLTDAQPAMHPALVAIQRALPSQPTQQHLYPSLITLQRRLRARRSPTQAEAQHLQERASNLRQRMTQLLWQAEHQSERYEAALSTAHALLAAHPNDPRLSSLFAHMARRSTWQHVATVQQSAGLYYIEHQGWHPESPWLRTHQALLPPLRPDEHIVTGHGRLLLALNNLQAAEFEITLEANELPYTPRMPMTAVYQIDDQEPVQVQLPPGDPRQTVHLAVPKGQHALRFYIREPVVNQFLRLSIIEQRPSSVQPLHHRFERVYHVATHTEPVEIVIAGPSWLRIDRWHQGGTQTHYQAVAPGWQTLKFYPEPGEREAHLRLFQRIPAPEADSPKPRQPLYVPDRVPSPMAHWAPLPRHARVELHDAYPLGTQEDGTWSFGSQLVSRYNEQEDVSLSEAERFVAISLTHRYVDPFRHLYVETEAIGRGRTDGGPTLGLQHILAFRPANQDLTLRVLGTGFVQLPTLGTPLAGSGLFRLSASRDFALGPEATHLPTISLFARLLSLDKSQAKAADGRIDLDVFSTFKADHQVGLSLADTFTYRPWLDTIWSGQLQVVTNQDFNPLQPDHITLQLEWKQLLGALQLHSAYRFGYFLADDDRRRSIDRHTLLFEAHWEHWRSSQQRFEVRLQTRYDLRTGDLGLLFDFIWHTGAGRGYRDFRPGVINFHRLRQYRIPKGRSNRLTYVETS